MNYGIPYMGSKQDIIGSLVLNFPKAENFYDLFGGGFSVTHYMLLNKAHWYKNFFYNEIKSDIVELVKDAIAGKFNYDVFTPEWISKERFKQTKDTDALTRIVWSFGNNQRQYLFREEIEIQKKSLHMAVVFGEFDDAAVEILGINCWPDEVKTIKQRRFYLRQKITHTINNKKTDNSKQLFSLNGLQPLERLERIQALQQLQGIERLQNLNSSLKDTSRLNLLSGSYDQVPIKPNSIVYCDIPYEGTSDYGAFDREAFFKWTAAQTFPIYISEYNVSDPGFKLIYTIDKHTSFSGKGQTLNGNKERVYWNGIGVK